MFEHTLGRVEDKLKAELTGAGVIEAAGKAMLERARTNKKTGREGIIDIALRHTQDKIVDALRRMHRPLR